MNVGTVRVTGEIGLHIRKDVAQYLQVNLNS